MIDSYLTRRDLLVKVAKMYYREGFSQQKIAKKIAVSRPHVSRMLKTCRELNIVEIRINDTSSMGSLLQKELAERFHLANVIVTPSVPDAEQNKERVGQAAAHLLETFLRDGMTVGISWGSSLNYLVEHFSPRKYLDVEVVQLIGGIAARNLQIDGLELARKLSRKLNGIYHVLQAPLVVQSEALKKMLVQEPDIAQVLEKGRQADIAVVGIGTTHYEHSALVRAGYMSKEQAENLLQRGAVGDIFGQQIDIHGNICDFELNKRTVGINLQQLKHIPVVIGVAAGAGKAEVIHGAIKGGFITMLVTDEAAAMRIVSMDKE